MDGNRAFSSIMVKKMTSMYFGSLLMSFELIVDFIKKIPNMLSLIASILFNNPMKFGSNKCHRCHFDPSYNSLHPTPLLFIPTYIKCIVKPIQCT